MWIAPPGRATAGAERVEAAPVMAEMESASAGGDGTVDTAGSRGADVEETVMAEESACKGRLQLVQGITGNIKEKLLLLRTYLYYYAFFSCVCDDGWTGRFCEHAEERECTDDIDNDGSKSNSHFL